MSHFPLLVSLSCAALVMNITAAFGEWDIQTRQSEMTDKVEVFLSTDSIIEIPNNFNIGTVRPTLWVRCADNKTAILVDWHRYITTGGLDNEQAVRYRIDDKPARTATWGMSTNFEATGLWRGGTSIPIVRQMLSAKQMIIETTPYGDNAVQARFDISNLEKYIEHVANACGWNPK
jgi:type VI secretion system protein VasI